MVLRDMHKIKYVDTGVEGSVPSSRIRIVNEARGKWECEVLFKIWICASSRYLHRDGRMCDVVGQIDEVKICLLPCYKRSYSYLFFCPAYKDFSFLAPIVFIPTATERSLRIYMYSVVSAVLTDL